MDTVPILKRREVWVALVDAIAGLISLITAVYIAPTQPDTAKFIIGVLAILQVPVGVLIAAFTIETKALIEAGFYRSKQGLIALPRK